MLATVSFKIGIAGCNLSRQGYTNKREYHAVLFEEYTIIALYVSDCRPDQAEIFYPLHCTTLCH